MIELHILSIVIGLAVGYFIGAWLMCFIAMKNWSDGYKEGSEAAKSIYWDFEEKEKELIKKLERVIRMDKRES